MNSTLLIFGLGHLAKFVLFENEQHTIAGTYRNVSQVKDLGCEKFFFDPSSNMSSDLPSNVDYVLWNYPPIKEYQEVLSFYHGYFSSKTKWIFISSTSVFGIGDISELSKPAPARENGRLLVALEQFLKSLKRETTIIRPGGLIDEIRNPAKRLSKSVSVLNSDAAVNIVHTRDVARFILYVIKKSLWSTDFNLVCDCHESREKFYTREMHQLGLKVPEWQEGKLAPKVVSNAKVKATGFDFLYDFTK